MDPINLDRSDEGFIASLTEELGRENLLPCYTCRTCTASCPISAINDRFNPSKIIRLCLYGLKEEVLAGDFIWLCSVCYACQERCPQGVRITDLMTALRNLAVREGHMPSGVRAQKEIITKWGRIYPIDDFDNKKREKLGLPGLPTSCEAVERLLS